MTVFNVTDRLTSGVTQRVAVAAVEVAGQGAAALVPERVELRGELLTVLACEETARTYIRMSDITDRRSPPTQKSNSSGGKGWSASSSLHVPRALNSAREVMLLRQRKVTPCSICCLLRLSPDPPPPSQRCTSHIPILHTPAFVPTPLRGSPGSGRWCRAISLFQSAAARQHCCCCTVAPLLLCF